MNYTHLSSHINLANLLVSSYKTLYTNYSTDILMRLPAIHCEPRVQAHLDDNYTNERDAWIHEAARFHVIDLYKKGLNYEFQHHKKSMPFFVMHL